jgi:hypothetical protein
MDVFCREHVGSHAPRLAGDEPLPAIFAGTPPQVARYLAEQMVAQPETLAPLTAELTHLASFGRASDSLSMVLRNFSKVTVRPDAARRLGAPRERAGCAFDSTYDAARHGLGAGQP